MEDESVSLSIEIASCTFCNACELTCSFIKEGFFSLAHSRIQIVQVYEQGVNIPIVCVNCTDAPCIEVCPTNAIYREEQQKIVQIDADLCSGCAECVEVCPYGAVYIPPDKDVAVMCDLCGGEPACVHNCLYGAIKFESKPDAVFSALELEPSTEPIEEKQWAIATMLAEQVDESREVIG